MATDQKSSEITAIAELLGMLDLSGATVAIDAMGCQKRIAEAIVDAKADYVLTLKDNQPTLHQQVRDCFESAQPAEARPRRYGGFAPQSRRRAHRLRGRRDAASSGFRRHS